jgi:hypothetical protein
MKNMRASHMQAKKVLEDNCTIPVNEAQVLELCKGLNSTNCADDLGCLLVWVFSDDKCARRVCDLYALLSLRWNGASAQNRYARW